MEEDDQGIEIRPPGQQRPPNPEWFCTPCMHQSVSESAHKTHLGTKAHSAKVNSVDEMNEHDFYVDEDTAAYKIIMATKTKFSGCEYIVLDNTDGDTKCILCKAILRDQAAIMDHLKSQKHLFAYVDKHYPEVFRSIQRKAKSKQEINALMQKQAEELIKKYGKKEPLVHERGYYDTLPDDIKLTIDRHLEARRREHNDQRKCRLDSTPVSTAAVSTSTTVPSTAVSTTTTTTTSSTSHSHRNRSRSRSPNRRRRSTSRDRSRRRSTSPRRGGGRGRHERDRTPDKSRASRDRSDRDKDRERDKDKDGRSRDRGSSNTDKKSSKTNSKTDSEILSPAKQKEIDNLEELPTEFEIFDVLYRAPVVCFGEKQAYIQELLNALEGPMIGMDYILEYGDPHSVYEPGYICTLCDCRLNPPQAVRHAISDKHTMNYLRKHYERQHMALQIKTLSDEVRTQMKAKQMMEIAAKETRMIKQYIKLTPKDTQCFRHHRRLPQTQTDTDQHKDRHRDKDNRQRDSEKDKHKDNTHNNVSSDHHSKSKATGSSSSRRHDTDNRTSPKKAEAAKSKPKHSAEDREKAAARREQNRREAEDLAKLRKVAPPFCEWSMEEGWYSIRKMSLEYYRRMSETGAMYYSIRDPEFHKKDFYGDWNPQVMRRLQDKFNFKLEHIRWLQKLLMDWRVPLYVPLQQPDLKPLEEEVESAVLDELLNRTLKPVDFMKGMKVITYEKKCDTETVLVSDKENDTDIEVMDEEQAPSASASASGAANGSKRAAAISITLSGPDNKKPALEKSTLMSKRSDKQTVDDTLLQPANEQEKAMLGVIDQLLHPQSRNNQQNDVLVLIVSFTNARQLLFRLARLRPSELQRLVDLARRPVLKAPEAMIVRLRHMLHQETLAIEQDKALKQMVEATQKDKDEEAKKQKELELKQRIDQARQEKLNSRRGAKEAVESVSRVVGTSAGATGLQMLTPLLPGAASGAGSTQSTASFPMPIAATMQQPINHQAVLNAISGVTGQNFNAFSQSQQVQQQMAMGTQPGMMHPGMTMPPPFPMSNTNVPFQQYPQYNPHFGGAPPGYGI